MKLGEFHNQGANHFAEKFIAADLGAPFKVILHQSVPVTFRPNGEILNYTIPDFAGLVRMVVITRLLHPRKLSGDDIKFVRKAICVKQKVMAASIEISPEYLSRCEANAFTMSPASEKLLRIFALKTVFRLHTFKACDAKAKFEEALDRLFDRLKPVPVHNHLDVLELHFRRSKAAKEDDCNLDGCENGEWNDDTRAAA